MANVTQEELAKKATFASQKRKRIHIAKVEMMKHMSQYIEQIENLRALTEIIAEQNDIEPQDLVDWVAREIFLPA